MSTEPRVIRSADIDIDRAATVRNAIEEMYEDLRVKAEYAQEKERMEIKVRSVDRSESKNG